MNVRPALLIPLLVAIVPAMALADSVVVTFDDVSLAPNSYFNGPVSGGTTSADPYGGSLPVTSGTFASGGVRFVNQSNPNSVYQGVATWGGFAVSNTTDTTSQSYGNQFSAIAGSGADPGLDNYGVGFGFVDGLDPTDPGQLADLPWFELPDGARFRASP